MGDFRDEKELSEISQFDMTKNGGGGGLGMEGYGGGNKA